MEPKIVNLDLKDVLPNRFQPRIKFSEESIQELANSIKEHGVIQPIVVRNIGDKYEIIAGERRYKASLLAGKQTIPAIINNLSDKDSSEVALIENVQRKDLTPIEEAISYKKILDMGYLTQETLASKLGKNQSTIANKLRLLNLDDDVQEALLNEQISERHARSLLRLTNHQQQKGLLNRIIKERLTVRKTDEEIDKMINENNKTEVLNMNQQPVQQTNNGNVEVFNPNIETLNIPTNPIVEPVPEIFPGNQSTTPINNTSFFNPQFEPVNQNLQPNVEDLEATQQLDLSSLNNIPTVPIEEKSVEQPINNINSMNVNQPEVQSTNLEPQISIEQPASQIEEFKPINTTEQSSDGNTGGMMPGRFFNFMTQEENEHQNTTTNQSDNFNFNLDIDSLNNISSTDDLPSLDSIIGINSSENIINPTPEINSVPNTPVMNQSSDIQPPIDTLNQFNSNNQIMPNIGVENTNQNVQNINSNGLLNSNLEVSDNIINENPSINIGQPEVRNEMLNPTPLVQVNNQGMDIKNAINKIRALSDELEKLGFVIETEEFDFENMYQVIFKINK